VRTSVNAEIESRGAHDDRLLATKRADARQLPIRGSSVDVAICSPPYLNAIDYLRGHKFSLIRMGHSIEALRELRSANIGTEADGGPSGRTVL
jgi:hypothetical protein